MSELLYIWLGIGFGFIIFEMLTVTLYGLSMSIGAFITALYVYFSWEKDISILQIVIFSVISTILVLIFPKFFHIAKNKNAKTGIEVYVWKVYKLKKVQNDWKVEIDWVDYLIDKDCVNENFEIWKKARVDSFEWSLLQVTII